MRDLPALTEYLRQGRALADDQIAAAVEALASPDLAPETKAEFLIALKDKGETTEELAGFATEFRQRSIPVPVDEETRRRGIIDVCGTGGDRLNTFNISSGVAILVAAAGVTVAKHGSRAITSQCGSSEVLETLGIRIDLPPEEAARSLRENNFAFFFAPKYHPVFANVMPARKICSERGCRTIFNLTGPLLNPARPDSQLVGVPRPELCEPIAVVLRMLGLTRAMVVSGQAGDKFFDELSVVGPSTATTFEVGTNVRTSTVNPTEFGMGFAKLDDLRGGDRHANAAIIRAVLGGDERGAKRDVVLLNAAAAFQVAGRASSMGDGLKIAAETIDSGAAAAKLKALAQI